MTSFYELPVTFSLSSESDAPFSVCSGVREGGVTSAGFVPTADVISYLTGPRQYRMTVTAREEHSNFKNSTQVGRVMLIRP